MREKIKEILKSVLKLAEVPDNISTQNCVQWDSLHHLSLMIELESAFNISLEPDEMNKMKDLEMIENVISKKTK